MNVSEFTDVSTATDSLISSIQAFKYTAEESMDVVDILNTIGNNYAISTADLAQSLTKSSGSLVAANGTLEEAVALTATANTIIQDADVVGTALKTVAMRLRGTSTEELEEEGLDTDGAVESKSKLRSKIKGLSGVDILTDTGAYKSTYQILAEIAEVWKDIDDMDQAALLELLAGKRAGSVMSAILQNPETLKNAFESANTAAGSAIQENEKYLDSIQGRIDLFTNSVQTMWNNTLDDEWVKFWVDVGTELIKIIDSLGLIKTLFMGIGTYLIQKNFGSVLSADREALSNKGLQDKLSKFREKSTDGGRGERRYTSAVERARARRDELKQEYKSATDPTARDAAKARYDAFNNAAGYDIASLDQTKAKQMKTQFEQELSNVKTNGVAVKVDTSNIDSQIQEIENKIQSSDDMIFKKKLNTSHINVLEDSLKAPLTELNSIEADLQYRLESMKANLDQSQLDNGGMISIDEKQIQEYQNLQNQLRLVRGEEPIGFVDPDAATHIREVKQEVDGLQSKLGKVREKDKLLPDMTTTTNELETAKTKLGELKAERDKLIQESSDSAKQTRITELENEIKKCDDAIDAAGKEMVEFSDTTENTGKVAPKTWTKIKDGAKKAGKAIKEMAQSMLMMYAITTTISLITKGIETLVDWIKNSSESAEEAQRKFDDLNGQLSNCKSELKSLESELDSTQKQIDDLMEQGPLTYAEQEELDRLKSVSAELERQIGLKETLQESLQKGTNAASINATNKYMSGTSFYSEKSKTERQEEAEEKWSTIGQAAGLVLGAAATIAAIALIPGTGGLSAAAIPTIIGGAGLGAAVGGGVGQIAGASSAGRVYDSEETVGEALANMAETRAKLEKSKEEAYAAYIKNPQDKNIAATYEEAEQALSNYDETLAKHISQIQANYNAMDWETASTEQRLDMIKQADLLDTYSITMGTAGAKDNALTRIFGDEASDQIKAVKKNLEAAYVAGEEFNLEKAFNGNTAACEEFKTRLYEMGIYVTDLEGYFTTTFEAAQKEADGIDLDHIISEIAEVTDGLDGLKDAFEEIAETGSVSAKTLVGLQEQFGKLGSAWDNYCELVFSGTATTEEMTAATEALAAAFIESKIASGEFTKENKWAYVTALKNLGLENAEEYVDAQLEAAMYREIADSGEHYDPNAVYEIWKDKIEQKFLSEDELAEKWAKLTPEDIDELGKKYGLAKEITEETAKAIAERYGIEVEGIDEVIEKIKQKNELEAKQRILQNNQDEYDKWLNQDGGYKKTVEEIERYEKLLGDFNPNDYTQAWESGPYEKWSADGTKLLNVLSVDEYGALKESYNKLQELKKRYEELKKEGEDKGYIIDDEVVDPGYKNELEKVEGQIKQTIDEIEDTYSVDIKIDLGFESMERVGSVFDQYTSKMETLADIQKEVSDGFTISAERAKEFAAVYPEILQGARTTATGQIALNADVVNAFLEGKRAELNAQLDAEIAKIDADIAALESKKALAEAQLELMMGVANGEIKMDIDTMLAKINNANALAAAMEAAGVDTTSANRLALAAMAGNQTEYEEIVKEVAQNNALNFDQSACDTATSILTNFTNAQETVRYFMQQCQEAAKAVAGIPSGEVQGEVIGSSDAGGVKTVDLTGYKVSKAVFKGTDAEEPVEFVEIDPYQFMGQLQTEIDGYVEGINELEGQKALLEAQKNRALETFDPDVSGSDDYGASEKAAEEAQDAFQKAMDYWENRIKANQARYEQLQNEIDLIEKQGKIAGEDYYKEQIKLENQRLSLLQQQRAEALKFLGTFEEGSDEWWDVAHTLNDLEGEIDSVTSSIQDLNDAMDQIKWTIFDEVHERFDNLTTQLETVRELLSADEDSLFNDEGEWTKKGVAVLGTYIQEIEIYKNALKDVEDELANIKLEDFDSEQEYYDKLTELTEKQQDYAKSVSDSEQSVMDMYESQIDAIEEYTGELVESYNEYIDVVKEALDAERELYEFKKDIEKQTKDISELERRIASLSGSDNAADVAERRKLEAELYEAKEGLNDTYYNHAKESQMTALEEEATAYEESLTNYVEKLRTTLEEARLDMDMFMGMVTESVMLNAGIVKDQYIQTGITLDKSLVDPWDKAIAAMSKYEKDGLSKMNAWTTEEGFFGKFKTNATNLLKSPWSAGTTAVNSFKSAVSTAMDEVVKRVQNNVVAAKAQLRNLYRQIQDTEKKAKDVKVSESKEDSGAKVEDSGDDTPTYKVDVTGTRPVTFTSNAKLKTSLGTFTASGTGTTEADAKSRAKNNVINEVIKHYKSQGYDAARIEQIYRSNNWDNKIEYYAKGTLGTKRDEYAITDEPWLGDELTMYATKQGTLSYMRAGSTVVPADLTKELIAIGEVGLDGLTNMPKFDSGVNLMSNVVNKPEFNLNFDNLLHVDNCTKEVLPEVQKLVETQLEKFTRQLNYSLKRVGAR